jgi:hypothetical protein
VAAGGSGPVPRSVCRMTSASGSTEENGEASDLQRMGNFEGRMAPYGEWLETEIHHAQGDADRKRLLLEGRRGGSYDNATTSRTRQRE